MSGQGTKTADNAKRPWIILMTAVVLLSSDRWFKSLAIATGQDGMTENILGLPIDFRLFMNDGIAFSLAMPDWIFWPTAVSVTGVLFYFLFKTWKAIPAASVAIIFILLGGLSNVIDRIMFGGVVDYLIFFDLSAVNIADGMILGGAIGTYIILRKK